jgi:hypothetical protein
MVSDISKFIPSYFRKELKSFLIMHHSSKYITKRAKKSESARNTKFIDLTGSRFGKLTVIKRADVKCAESQWLCQCDCGDTVTLRSSILRYGHRKDCGCITPDRNWNRAKRSGKKTLVKRLAELDDALEIGGFD